MANIFTHVPYRETGYFSTLANDYIAGHPNTKPFFTYTSDAEGVKKAIAARSEFPIDRSTLVSALRKQYHNLPQQAETDENIELLLQENTFTVCTAHQPNLLTGYLYFVYKILHAIKLAEQLNLEYPEKQFVPVYYMGSEDNDLDELGSFRFQGQKYTWNGNGQQGAVGRMHTGSLKNMLHELFKVFGPPGNNNEQLKEMLTEAYLQHQTIAEATQYLVHKLFGRYGLLVLNPDDASLKAAFIPVMEDELLHHHAVEIIDRQIKELSAHYKIQAHPREINLFYLADNLRERIEAKGGRWEVVGTSIQWDKDELLAELRAHPERFSPNVMLRGLFQETILPNVAFIGGGAEVAYWLQLKPLFEHYKVFYPAILLRQSVLWIRPEQTKLRGQLELSIPEIFPPEIQIANRYVLLHTSAEWQTQGEEQAIEHIFQSLKTKAALIDPTLKDAADAALTKARRQFQSLQKKMFRAEKKKMQTQVARIGRLKSALFPDNSLQERIENFTEYYLEYGPAFFDTVKDGIEPLGNKFLVIAPAASQQETGRSPATAQKSENEI